MLSQLVSRIRSAPTKRSLPILAGAVVLLFGAIAMAADGATPGYRAMFDADGKFLKKYGSSGPSFDIVADLNRKKTKRYHRTTAYLIDKTGVVRQVFPMLVHSRPSWKAILGEMDRILTEDS